MFTAARRVLLAAFIAVATIVAGLGLAPASSAASVTTLKIVNGYTPAALKSAGSLRELQDVSAMSIATINTALSRSAIPMRVELVGLVPTSGMSESAGEQSMLSALGDPKDSTFASAKAYRAGAGAHALIVLTSGTGGGGLAYVNTYGVASKAVGVVDVEATKRTNGMNYAHEFGHILGLQHDTHVRPSSSSAVGFVDTRHGIRDLMSYPNACDAAKVACRQVAAYSDPNLTLSLIHI